MNRELDDKLWRKMDGVFIYKEWTLGPFRIRRVRARYWLVYDPRRTDVFEFTSRKSAVDFARRTSIINLLRRIEG